MDEFIVRMKECLRALPELEPWFVENIAEMVDAWESQLAIEMLWDELMEMPSAPPPWVVETLVELSSSFGFDVRETRGPMNGDW